MKTFARKSLWLQVRTLFYKQTKLPFTTTKSWLTVSYIHKQKYVSHKSNNERLAIFLEEHQ